MANFSIKAVVGATTAPFRRAIGGLAGFVKRSFSGIGGILAGVLSVGVVKGLFDEFDRLAKLARQLRLPASTVQKFSVAAQLGGTNVESFSKGLLQSERNAIKAEQGLTTYQRAFADLGIDTSKFINLGIEEKLLRLADAYADADDKGAAVAALQETLGRSGRELIPTLEQGSDGLRELLDNVKVLEDSEFAAIEELNDQLTLTANNLKTLLIPVIIELIGFFAFLGVRVKQGIVILKEYGKEALKTSLAVATLGTSLAFKGARPDFGGATDRLGGPIEDSEKALDSFLNKLDSAKNTKPFTPIDTTDVETLIEALDTIEKINSVKDGFSDYIERARASAEGLSSELDFVDLKLFEVEKQLRGLGEANTENVNLKEILELTEKRISLEKELNALDDKANEQFSERNASIERLANERKILELRAEGRTKEANILERQAQAVADAKEFLDSIGVAFEGVNAEAAIAEFQEIQALQEQISERSNQQSSAVTAAFRNIGANDPIGVALSGPFDKQVEAQKETTRAVEEQTRAILTSLDEVVDAVEDRGTTTITFGTLS